MRESDKKHEQGPESREQGDIGSQDKVEKERGGRGDARDESIGC